MKVYILLTLFLSAHYGLAEEDPNCADDVKKMIKEGTDHQKACIDSLGNKDGQKVGICIADKLGVLKESKDSFDFAKVKQFIRSKMSNEELRKEIIESSTQCETSHPDGKENYVDCVIKTFQKICPRPPSY